MTTIKRDNQPPIRYRGEVIGSRSTRHHDSNRWTVWTIHLTASGRVILETVHRSQWQGERDEHTAAVYLSPAALCDQLRSGSVNDELSELLGELYPDHWVEVID